jgi:hypothetical protein
MGTAVAFTIHDHIDRVLEWFLDELQLTLAGVRDREGGSVDVVVGEATKVYPRKRGVAAEILVPAHRDIATRVPSDSSGATYNLKHDEVPREPVIKFLFAWPSDGVYVGAHCDERLVIVQRKFLDFLKSVQGRYPEVGPQVREYESGLIEREKENLRRQLVAESAFDEEPQESVNHASLAAQLPVTHASGANAAEKSGPPTTTDLEDPEIRERKMKLMELWKVGCRRCDAARKLTLSESTVKRLSKELGIDWRTPKAKR